MKKRSIILAAFVCGTVLNCFAAEKNIAPDQFKDPKTLSDVIYKKYQTQAYLNSETTASLSVLRHNTVETTAGKKDSFRRLDIHVWKDGYSFGYVDGNTREEALKGEAECYVINSSQAETSYSIVLNAKTRQIIREGGRSGLFSGDLIPRDNSLEFLNPDNPMMKMANAFTTSTVSVSGNMYTLLTSIYVQETSGSVPQNSMNIEVKVAGNENADIHSIKFTLNPHNNIPAMKAFSGVIVEKTYSDFKDIAPGKRIATKVKETGLHKPVVIREVISIGRRGIIENLLETYNYDLRHMAKEMVRTKGYSDPGIGLPIE